MTEVPAEVASALVRAEAQGFAYSCEPPVGPLLAALAAAVPPDGRVLELGTGKRTGLHLTVAALRPRGVLVLDDLDLAKYPAEHVPTAAAISRTLLADDRLAVAPLPTGSGLLLATRRA